MRARQPARRPASPSAAVHPPAGCHTEPASHFWVGGMTRIKAREASRPPRGVHCVALAPFDRAIVFAFLRFALSRFRVFALRAYALTRFRAFALSFTEPTQVTASPFRNEPNASDPEPAEAERPG